LLYAYQDHPESIKDAYLLYIYPDRDNEYVNGKINIAGNVDFKVPSRQGGELMRKPISWKYHSVLMIGGSICDFDNQTYTVMNGSQYIHQMFEEEDGSLQLYHEVYPEEKRKVDELCVIAVPAIDIISNMAETGEVKVPYISEELREKYPPVPLNDFIS